MVRRWEKDMVIVIFPICSDYIRETWSLRMTSGWRQRKYRCRTEQMWRQDGRWLSVSQHGRDLQRAIRLMMYCLRWSQTIRLWQTCGIHMLRSRSTETSVTQRQLRKCLFRATWVTCTWCLQFRKHGEQVMWKVCLPAVILRLIWHGQTTNWQKLRSTLITAEKRLFSTQIFHLQL